MAGSRPRDRREQIVRAATELFCRDGFDAVSMKRIGEAVGISGPAIYRHFPDKDALLDAAGGAYLDAAVMTWDDPELPVRASVELMLADPASALTNAFELDHLLRLPGYRKRLDSAGVAVLRRVRRANPACSVVDAAGIGLAVHGALAELDLLAGRKADSMVNSPALPGDLAGVVAGALDRMFVVAVPAHEKQLEGHVTQPDAYQPEPRREEEIVRAAVNRFRTQGFHGVTMEEIASDIGISASGLYRYFESKQDILLEACSLHDRNFELELARATASARDPRGLLHGYAAALVDNRLKDIDMAFVRFRALRLFPIEIQREMRRASMRHLRTIAQLLLEVRPEVARPEAHVLAVCSTGAAQGFARSWQIEGLNERPSRDLGIAAIEAFWGVAPNLTSV
jgi:AcrR family transcriptional regulator